MTPRILLVTTSNDITTDYVILALRERKIPHFRINTDAFPQTSTASVTRSNTSQGTQWTGPEGTCDLNEIRAVYYRRQRIATFPDHLDAGTKDFCARETAWFLQGTLQSLTHAAWMNPPAAVAAAEAKLYQLHHAAHLGFRIPDTLTSNRADDVRVFAARHQGRLVAKPVRSGYITYPTGQGSIFTSTVSDEDLTDLSGLTLAPVTFQEHILKACDLRVTVVGATVFATAILSQEDPAARTDWRAATDDHLHHTPHDLPDHIAQRCKALVLTLGLTFGAIDLILTPSGEYVFLEINPSGQWAWLQDKTQIPISDTIATWLEYHTR